MPRHERLADAQSASELAQLPTPMIATRMRFFVMPRRAVVFLFLVAVAIARLYLSLIESWRPTWTTRSAKVIDERSARAKTAATNSA